MIGAKVMQARDEAQPEPQGAQQPEGAAGAQGEAPTPEEQAAYDMFVRNAMELLYPANEDGAPSAPILNDLGGDLTPEEIAVFEAAEPPISPEAPVDRLAATTALIVLAVDQSGTSSGAQIGDEIVYAGGVEILEQLADMAEAAGLHDYSEEEMEAALYRAVDLFRVASPRVDQDALTQQFEQVLAADREGRLGEVLPGIEQRMQGGAA